MMLEDAFARSIAYLVWLVTIEFIDNFLILYRFS